jgi:hypothetical protein
MANNDDLERSNRLLREQAENAEFVKDAFRSMAAVISEAIEDSITSMEGFDNIGEQIARSAEKDITGSFRKLGKQLENNVTIQAKILKGQNASKDIQNARIKLDARLVQTSAAIRQNQELSKKAQEELVAQAEEQADFAYASLDALEDQNKAQMKSISLFKITGGILSNMANKLDKSGALAELLKGDFGQITSERIGEAGVISAVDILTTGLIDVSNQTTQFQRNLGLSADKANDLRNRLGNIALLSGETALNTTTIVNAFEALNSLGTANVAFSDELLEQVGLLETQLGMSADQQARFGFESLKSGKSVNDILDDSVATVGAVEKITGLELDRLKVVQEASNVTGEIRAQLGFSIKNISQAIAKAKSFGMTLQDLAGISNNLLDFQSSISAELEAELFLGKDLNLERARLAALTGDYEVLTSEIMKNVGGEYEFSKLNTLERRKYAAALGMSVDQMSDLVYANANLAELEKEALDRGDKDLAQNIRALSLQQEFSLLIEKVQQSLVSLADGPLGDIAKILIKTMENAGVVYGALAGIAGIQLAGIIAQFVRLVGVVGRLTKATALAKIIANPLVGLAAVAAGIGAGVLIDRALGPAEDATIQNAIITKKARGTVDLTPFSSADQVAIGTNLFGGGGGASSQPIVNISGVTLTADKFGKRTVYSDGLDQQTAFS